MAEYLRIGYAHSLPRIIILASTCLTHERRRQESGVGPHPYPRIRLLQYTPRGGGTIGYSALLACERLDVHILASTYLNH